MFTQTIELILSNSDHLAKIITGIAPVISLFFGSKIRGFFTSHLDMRKEYPISRQLILDVTNEKSLNPFLVEKGFAASTGCNKLNADEILFILKLNRPSEFLKKYLVAMNYVICSSKNELIEFKAHIRGRLKRGILKYLALIGYASFFFFSTYVWTNNKVWELSIENKLGLGVLSIFAICWAILFLFTYRNINVAERLVSNGDKFQLFG